MSNIYAANDRQALLDRLSKLRPDSARQWGKMDAAQMLAHCAIALETGTGEHPRKQAFIGKILSPFVRSSVLGDKPFSKNSPTDPTFVIADTRNFESERARLIADVDRFVQLGPEHAGKQTHSFFGKMTGDEWGKLMYKHLDHHFQQFGV